MPHTHAIHGVQIGGDGSVVLYDYPDRGEGEAVHPRTGGYRCVCRSLVVVPSIDGQPGTVYWTNAKGDVLQFNPQTESVSVALDGTDGMMREYFGSYVVIPLS